MEEKNSSWKYAFIAIAGVLIIAGAILMFNKGSVTGNVVNNENVKTVSAKALIDDDAVLGSTNAPVTIVQFTDWQCPFCRRFETDTFVQLKQDYIDTDKVKFVTRDFPLESIHPGALPAAMAAECVKADADDSAYYAFKQKVTEEQNKLDSGIDGPVTKTVQFTNADLISWAQALGYDIKSCLESQTYASEVRKDLSDGQAAGVRGTPAFLIINKKGTSTLLSGAQPYSAFKTELDKALA